MPYDVSKVSDAAIASDVAEAYDLSKAGDAAIASHAVVAIDIAVGEFFSVFLSLSTFLLIDP